MKEQLISFDTAKLAKEKGFNVYIEHMQTYFSHEMWDKYLYPNSDVGDFQYSETAKRTKDIGFALNENYPVPFYEPYYIIQCMQYLYLNLNYVALNPILLIVCLHLILSFIPPPFIIKYSFQLFKFTPIRCG